LLTEKQTDRQTNNVENITSLAKVKTEAVSSNESPSFHVRKYGYVYVCLVTESSLAAFKMANELHTW